MSASGGLHPGEAASRGSLHLGGEQTLLLEIHGILWDAVNKRAVRIPLECILVTRKRIHGFYIHIEEENVDF